MEYKTYIVTRRAKIDGIGGYVNLPYGTEVSVDNNGFICYQGRPICADTSENAHIYFSQNDDGNGVRRGSLVRAIKNTIERRDSNYQNRWDKVWKDPLCQKYKIPEFDDFWLWNHDFYNADIEDLKYIANLIGAKEGR